MYEDKKNEEEFLRKYNLKKVKEDYIHKFKLDLAQSFLDDYYEEENIPFDGDFKKLYKMLTRNGKFIIPKEFILYPIDNLN